MAREGFHLTIAGATAALVLGQAPAALGQVLDIQPDGGVVTYAGPAVYTSDGARPILAPVPTGGSRQAPPEVAAAIQESAARHALPAPVVEAVAWQESRFNQQALSPKGARGIMQLMPATASVLGVDAADLRANIDGGAAYLASQMRRFGDLSLALAAYNAGPEAVDRFGGVPPYAETQAYVRAILSRVAATSVAAVRAP
ncbi:MAG: lytic transglycosylase domain-containing protein [Caulobacterales bacterium]|nr:lytic transglycosylase domain-containing protein [Caulobacterales bacterium]